MKVQSREESHYDWERGRHRFNTFAVWYITFWWVVGAGYFVYRLATNQFDYWWLGVLLLVWVAPKLHRGHTTVLPLSRSAMEKALQELKEAKEEPPTHEPLGRNPD